MSHTLAENSVYMLWKSSLNVPGKIKQSINAASVDVDKSRAADPAALSQRAPRDLPGLTVDTLWVTTLAKLLKQPLGFARALFSDFGWLPEACTQNVGPRRTPIAKGRWTQQSCWTNRRHHVRFHHCRVDAFGPIWTSTTEQADTCDKQQQR
jgi:hypothetical protein